MGRVGEPGSYLKERGSYPLKNLGLRADFHQIWKVWYDKHHSRGIHEIKVVVWKAPILTLNLQATEMEYKGGACVAAKRKCDIKVLSKEIVPSNISQDQYD